MPGHKQNAEHLIPGLPYDLDLTEIHGFDDLHNPNGVLLETSKMAADLYGSKYAFPLVNGSTVGILAAIGAHTTRGDKILVTRKNHWSIENAAALFGLTPIFIEPTIDEMSGIDNSVDLGTIGTTVENNPEIKLVVVTSPSYEGVLSDIESIADIVHRHNIPLLVDSAHGAHLGFSQGFPDSAVHAGADMVVMSLHKTLPALTQCSVLHLCSERGKHDETKRLLYTLQTSSPSYLLMSSIDSCIRLIAKDKDQLFREYEQNLNRFSNNIKSLRTLFVLCNGNDISHCGFYDFDPGKLVIVTKNAAMSGNDLAQILRVEYKIEIERVCDNHVIAMTSICDTPEGFSRLASALVAIDSII